METLKVRKGGTESQENTGKERIAEGKVCVHDYQPYGALPSYSELSKFYESGEKTLVVSEKDRKGKLIGYTLIFRKEFPEREIKKFREKMGINRAKNIIDREQPFSRDYIKRWKIYSVARFLSMLREIRSEARFIPSKGHYFHEESGTFEKRKHNLTGGISAALLGFVFIVLIAKAPFTGAAVSNLIVSDYGIGISALIISLIAAAAYFALKPYKK